MSSRAEKERLKAQQEKFQAVLSGLLRDDDNKYCVDCDAKGPRWASWNLGIFMCIRCAGIHRNLGVHITKVKSVNLDQWNGDQIAMMMEMGNSRARAVYEANIPDNYRRPQTDSSALETFIRAKYEHKKYIAREWVPPKPTLPKELLEDDREKKKPRPKPSGSIQLSSVASRSQTTSTAPQTTASKPTPKPVQATTAKPAEPQQPKAPPPSSNTADLIGLVFAQPVVNDTHAPEVPRNSSNSLLTDFMGQDITGDLNTSSQNNVNQVSNDSIEAKLFDDTTAMSPESGQKTTTKDSIMALYGGQQKQQQFGVPASDQYTCTPAGIDPAGYTYTNVVAPGIDPAGYTYTNVGTPGYDPTGYMYTNGVSGGVYMPQQQQNMGMYNMPQQSNMPMQQAAGYNNQTGMVGMHQGNPGMVQANMGVPQAQMGVPPGMMMGQGNVGVTQGGMAVPQGSMGVPQGNAGMYGQQMQFQQMQNQMASLRMGQPAQMNVVGGGMQNGLPAGQGWGAAPSGGQTLSNNLWQ